MTAKEKAIELYEKMYINVPFTYSENEIHETARQFALIAVDEVLHALKYSMIEPTHAIVRYYEQVKQEIEKL